LKKELSSAYSFLGAMAMNKLIGDPEIFLED
jgi:hypothetical protein